MSESSEGSRKVVVVNGGWLVVGLGAIVALMVYLGTKSSEDHSYVRSVEETNQQGNGMLPDGSPAKAPERERNGQSRSSLFSFGKKSATWASGAISLDQDYHWVLKCPYCGAMQDYPYTTCGDCRKEFRIPALSCTKCGGDGKNVCPSCNGTGRGKCHDCNGVGYSARWQVPKYNKVTATCSSCDGTGKDSFVFGDHNNPCRYCGGSGKVLTEVKVPGSDRKKTGCQSCGGTGRSDCINCGGSKYFRCKDCQGKGHFEAIG